MKYMIAATSLALLSSSALADAWKISPKIYARGGVTSSTDFTRSTTVNKDTEDRPWNLGPWGDESNLFSDPLTELTINAEYGDEFKFTYGVDVEGASENHDQTAKPVNERMAYLTYFFGDHSLWVGSRPYRSEAEYLTRAFNFDNKNLYGGGFRFERLGPVNLEFAYGSFQGGWDDGSGNFTEEQTNVAINKVEVPLSNGRILTNLEVQQVIRTLPDGEATQRSHGYLAGVSYQRWGDKVFGGDLYNQLILHTSKGYVQQTAMGTAFNEFDTDYAAEKLLLQWNGDWKANGYGLYWAAIYQAHQGKDANKNFEDSEMVWNFADLIVRPQYALTSNLTLAVEYARRSIMKEGEKVTTDLSWAANGGGKRWATMLSYNLSNSLFNNPVVTLAYGEVSKDKEVNFFEYPNKSEKSSHFIRLNYEININ